MSILTTKRIRELYGMATRWDSDERTASIRQSNLAEFDAWITQHDAEVRTAALNAAADAVPPSTAPLGGQLAISEPVRMRFQQWLREQAGGAG